MKVDCSVLTHSHNHTCIRNPANRPTYSLRVNLPNVNMPLHASMTCILPQCRIFIQKFTKDKSSLCRVYRRKCHNGERTQSA